MNESMEYIKNDKNFARLIRAELLFMPMLICIPLIVGLYLIYDWYSRGFSVNNPDFTGQLILGIIILIGNIIFDIPFIRSLKMYSSKEK